jgi:NADH-quinone oxidoreductase subunit L
MNFLLPIIILSPLLAALAVSVLKNKREREIFSLSAAGIVLNFVTLIALTIGWIIGGTKHIFLQGPVLYKGADIEFRINLFLDGYGLAYLLLTTFLSGVIIVFSRSYIHREKGYKRFFSNILFFYFGLMIVLLSGNLETMFTGWEILGVTSFFLIGFYRNRYLPVKNALKVISLYRIADIAMLSGIWLTHHYFESSINFMELDGLHNSNHHIFDDTFYQFMIPGTFLLAAMVKSAQFPFSSWLPRAMEGPTTSSAIFYGSLSVHIGIFLLIRTAPFWMENLWFHSIIGGIGLVTVFSTTLIARVQSTIKTQIAYSSIAQIGLMFIEISFGLFEIAMIHFICNALLRSYQLLISPSVLSYKIHDQIFHFDAPVAQGKNGLLNKIKLSFYVLSIKEFNLDSFMFFFLWTPLKKAGNMFSFLSIKNTYIITIPLFLIGLYEVYNRALITPALLPYISDFYAIMGVILALKAFVERQSAMTSWILILINQLFQSLAFGFNSEYAYYQVHIYLSGIIVSGILGIWVINKLKSRGKNVSLNQFHGYAYETHTLAFFFVIACLGIAGFPITPTFIGEDLMLSHIHEDQFALMILIVSNIVLDGLVVFRIYSRLFLGKHKSGYHEFSYRSA